MSADPAVVTPIEQAAIRQANELYNSGKLDEAAQVIENYLLREPNDAQALTIAATILKKAKRLPIAYSLAKRSTELKPDRPEPWNAFGHCAQALWRQDEALSAYRKASQRAKSKQQEALYLNNIGSVHIDNGEFAKAEDFIRRSLTLDPADRMAKHNLGLCLLARREWREAWGYYSASVGTESRLNTKYMPEPGEPTWDGTKGKTVVIYGEQGLGDEICAASMYPDAIRDCGKLILDCDHRLAKLFRRSFPQAKVYGTRWQKGIAWDKDDRQIDYSIAGFEIGKLYRNEAKDFPGTPYLTPCPDRLAMWKALFASKGKPVIGIAWSGGTWQNAGMHRQLPLAEWQPIFDAVDAHWVSLQYKDARKEIAGTKVTQYHYATLTPDYDDTAALVAACDLVVGVQTSVFHLAGALGIPAWVMVPKVSQWRYGEAFADVPWYQSVKLYRQTDKWPVAQIAADLKERFG